MSELHFMLYREEPIVLLSVNEDILKNTFEGWLFRFQNDGYTKNYSFGIDLTKFYPIHKSESEEIKRKFIKFVLFNQETEYKRDMILNELSRLTRVIG